MKDFEIYTDKEITDIYLVRLEALRLVEKVIKDRGIYPGYREGKDKEIVFCKTTTETWT